MKTPIKFEFPIGIIKAYEEGEKEKEDKNKWYVEGLAATVDFDLQADQITADALKNAEKDLLDNSTVLDNHDPNKRIGHVVECKAQDEGLWVKVLISKTAKDIWQQIKEGVLNKFSIRGRIIDAIKKYVKELGRIVNVINEMYLMECSLVSLPANPQAKTMRWYISKSIKDFEAKGGEIPLAKELKKKEEAMDFETVASTLESLKDRLSEEDKSTITEIVASIKAGKEKFPDGFPLSKEKDETDEDFKKRVKKEFEEFLAARKKAEEDATKAKKETEDAEKARKEAEDAEKARIKKETEDAEKARKETEDAEKARIKKEEEDAAKATGLPYPKKKSGENYSQEEVDGILADVKNSVEDYFKGQLTKKDQALISLKEELMGKLDAVHKENKDLKGENEGLKADGKVEEEWNKISDSYKEEDAAAIKGILRKTFLGQALKPEEQSMLIEKKLSSDLIVGGGAPENKFDLTSEKEKDIIKYAGIRTRVKKE